MAALLLLGVFAAAYVGFALLALSQKQHWQRVTHSAVAASPRSRMLRHAGAVLLVASLALAILRDGPAFGAILWTVWLTVAGAAVSFTLTLRPHWLARLAAMFANRAR